MVNMIEVFKQMVAALEDTSASKHISRNAAIQAGLKAIAELESQEPVAWLLTDKNINSLEVDSIQRLIDRLKHAHYTNLCVRINGQDEWFQADWLKHMVRAIPPQRTEQWGASAMMNPDYIAEQQKKTKQIRAMLESQEPVVEMKALADNDSAYAYADGWNACVRKFKDTHPPQRPRIVFPTMLRKMWSGGEVQAWLDENVNKEKNNA